MDGCICNRLARLQHLFVTKDFLPDLTGAARCHVALARRYPKFRFRQSADPAECNIAFHDPRPRGIEDIARIREEFGYRPQFLPEAAYADYLRWLEAVPDYLGAAGGR